MSLINFIYMKKFIKYFANLKFAIFLLLLIAFFSSLGSIIEQDKSIEFYKNTYKSLFFNKPIWTYFDYLGLTHIYSCWWFYFLLLIFGITLLSCTFFQQFPVLKFARRYYFYTYKSQFNKLNYKFNFKLFYSSQLCYQLINNNYSICQRQTGFYGYKGLIGRIGPVIVHLSIILILIGSILGAVEGFTAQEFIPKSEIFHIQNLVKIGNLAKVRQQTFRINEFWINFNKLGLIKQFYTDISILSGNGYEIKRKTISVNNPFLFKELTIYQTDWGILGIRIKVSNTTKIVQLPVFKSSNQSSKLWVSWFPINISKNQGFILVINTAQGKIDLYDQQVRFIQTLSLGQILNFNNDISIKLIELIFSTGLQIKSDPGIKIIYVGFVSLIVSSFISYGSFSEFWLLEFNSIGIFGGKTNRDKVKFNIEMAKIEKAFNN
uniref:Cytochrome c biogenesis protein Ccs1 n=1 Tax=Vaucheria litorea TaxID=109269 RepID=B7T205_VAULI|nr:c-type cytochrome biogenensis protein [Vaucheria litorea]ACF70971.1 YCF44Res protein [Vaucheria litorea]